MRQAKNKKTTKEKKSVKTYYNYIGGEWVKSASNEYFENINPANTTDLIGRFPLSIEDDVNRAVEAAKEAGTRWRRTPAPRRAEIFIPAWRNFASE